MSPAIDLSGLGRRVEWAARCAPPSLRADAQQEAWLRIVQAAGRYDGRILAKTFFTHQANGAVKDFLRREDPLTRRQRAKVNSGADSAPVRVGTSAIARSCASRAVQDDLVALRELREAVERLEGLERIAIDSMLREETIEELSDAIGLSISAVAFYRTRAIGRLRRYLRAR